MLFCILHGQRDLLFRVSGWANFDAEGTLLAYAALGFPIQDRNPKDYKRINKAMIQFFQESVNYVNLPVTSLMIMTLLYWVMVMIGVFGFDSFDLDFDASPDIDIDAGFGIDANTGLDAAPATSIGSGRSTTGNDGFLRTVFEFFYLGEVPIVIIGSFFILFFWISTFVSNHVFNMDQSFLRSMLWLSPNLVISLVCTRISMIPFAILFKKPPPENIRREEMYGLIGFITTSEVTDTFGQMEIKLENEPEMRINVRTNPGESLARGDAAKIISFNNSNGTFLVELTKWEKSLDG